MTTTTATTLVEIKKQFEATIRQMSGADVEATVTSTQFTVCGRKGEVEKAAKSLDGIAGFRKVNQWTNDDLDDDEMPDFTVAVYAYA